MTESTGHAAVAAASSATIDAVFRRAFAVFADRVAVTSEDGSITYGLTSLGRNSWRCASEPNWSIIQAHMLWIEI